LSYIEKDCFKKSQNYCSTGYSRTKYHLEHPVSTITVCCKLHKSSIHDRAAVAKPLITECNAQMCKRWSPVMTLKPRQQTTGNVHVILSDESSFTLFPTFFSKSLCLENTQGSLESGMPVISDFIYKISTTVKQMRKLMS
jgi:hypothetical protein